MVIASPADWTAFLAARQCFETPYAGRILVSLEQIDVLVTDDAYTVRIGDQRLDGAFTQENEGQKLSTGAGSEPLALSDIRSATQAESNSRRSPSTGGAARSGTVTCRR